jgi:hypothetical protein
MNQLSKLVNFLPFDICLGKVKDLPYYIDRDKWDSCNSDFTVQVEGISLCKAGKSKKI